MEFPGLGEQCAVGDCRQLDFLPTKCDGCHKIFCDEHYLYAAHACPNPRRDVQLAVCPICSEPVPGKPDEDPNIRMNEHIARGCKPAPTTTSKVPAASVCATCKQKTLVPVKCPACQLNFCLKHRLDVDHDCKGPAKPVAKPAARKGPFSTTASNSEREAARQKLADADKERQRLAHEKWLREKQQQSQQPSSSAAKPPNGTCAIQ